MLRCGCVYFFNLLKTGTVRHLVVGTGILAATDNIVAAHVAVEQVGHEGGHPDAHVRVAVPHQLHVGRPPDGESTPTVTVQPIKLLCHWVESVGSGDL